MRIDSRNTYLVRLQLLPFSDGRSRRAVWPSKGVKEIGLQETGLPARMPTLHTFQFFQNWSINLVCLKLKYNIYHCLHQANFHCIGRYIEVWLSLVTGFCAMYKYSYLLIFILYTWYLNTNTHAHTQKTFSCIQPEIYSSPPPSNKAALIMY